MTLENEDTLDTTSTDDSADETATSDSPADDASSSVESSTEEEVEAVEETPEQKAEREKSERTAKRIAEAEEAEKRAEDVRKERQKVREQAEREERLSIREREAEQTLRRAQSLIEDLEKRADTVRRGGYDALKALGIDYGDWTKKTLEETGPEALAAKALREAEEVRAELRRRDQQAAAAQEREALEATKKQFEDFVDTNADEYPDAATLPSRALHILATEASNEYRKDFGAWPSFAALLPRLDKKAKEFHEEQKKKSAKRARSPEPSDGATTTTQATTNGQPANAPANRTLTPATATTRATPRRQMTPEEEEEWCLNELRQAMQADAKRAV